MINFFVVVILLINVDFYWCFISSDATHQCEEVKLNPQWTFVELEYTCSSNVVLRHWQQYKFEWRHVGMARSILWFFVACSCDIGLMMRRLWHKIIFLYTYHPNKIMFKPSSYNTVNCNRLVGGCHQTCGKL